MFSFVLKSYSNIDCSATSESSVGLPAQLQSVIDVPEKSRANRGAFERKIEDTQESYSQEHSAAPNVGPSDLRQGLCPWDLSFLISLKGQEKTDRLFDLYLGDAEMELSDINDIVDEKASLLSASPSVQTRMTTHRRLVNGTLQRTFEVMQIALLSDRFLGWSPFAITRELLSWLDGKRTD